MCDYTCLSDLKLTLKVDKLSILYTYYNSMYHNLCSRVRIALIKTKQNKKKERKKTFNIPSNNPLEGIDPSINI